MTAHAVPPPPNACTVDAPVQRGSIVPSCRFLYVAREAGDLAVEILDRIWAVPRVLVATANAEALQRQRPGQPVEE